MQRPPFPGPEVHGHYRQVSLYRGFMQRDGTELKNSSLDKDVCRSNDF